jgi:hypothetical protein
MECFAHPGTSAVGVCKSCGKAACRACVKDFGYAIACSDRCATEVEAAQAMTEKSKHVYRLSTDTYKVATGVIMWVLFGVFFTGFGIYQSIQKHELDLFLLSFGCVSLVYAFVVYRRTKDTGLRY